MMKQKVVSIVSGILALLLAVGPWTLFQACPTTEKVMKCHWCCRAVIPVAIILLVITVLQLLIKDTKLFRKLSLVGIVGFIMPILLTTLLIGGCMKPEMACNVVAFPVINTLSSVGIVLQVIGFLTKEK